MGQATQCIAPVLLWNVPRPQGEQLVAPEPPAKKPEGQGAQTVLPRTLEKEPGLQVTQLASDCAKSADDAVPAGQYSQDAEVPPATALKRPGGHETHVELLVAPTAFETVETGQRAQMSEPGCVANEPAAHWLHWGLPENWEYWPERQRAQALAAVVRPLPTPEEPAGQRPEQ
jgi:hypothetical protein